MDDCCGGGARAGGDRRWRRVLWAALAINAVMFAIEAGAGWAAGSVSLQADALDFLADTGSYAITLLVAGMALRYRALAACAKGLAMAGFGLWVVAAMVMHALAGTLPDAATMGAVGVDSNMRSVWLCSRNDVLGNLAVLAAAAGVFGSGTGWPDIIVAAIMAGLALQAAWLVLHQAAAELRRDGRRRGQSAGAVSFGGQGRSP